MIRRPPRSTRTDTLFPYATLFRSWHIPVSRCLREQDARISGCMSSSMRTKASGEIKICPIEQALRSEEHTSELQSLMRISYAVFCLNKKIKLNKKMRQDTVINQNKT